MACRDRAGCARLELFIGRVDLGGPSCHGKRVLGARPAHHRRNDTARKGSMTMRRVRERGGADGFSLVEILAALAVASIVLVATTALMRNVALHFDRGTRG